MLGASLLPIRPGLHPGAPCTTFFLHPCTSNLAAFYMNGLPTLVSGMNTHVTACLDMYLPICAIKACPCSLRTCVDLEMCVYWWYMRLRVAPVGKRERESCARVVETLVMPCSNCILMRLVLFAPFHQPRALVSAAGHEIGTASTCPACLWQPQTISEIHITTAWGSLARARCRSNLHTQNL